VWGRRRGRSWPAACRSVGCAFLRATVAITFAVAGCGGEARTGQNGHEFEDPLLLLAASDLIVAFAELEPAYEAATGTELTTVFGSSGNLAAQIRNGAPADVYISANEAFVDDLLAAGWIDPATRVEVAVGRLALVVPPGRAVPDGPGALTDPAYRVIAIANPEHAPYGMAARSTLRSTGVWATLGDRLVMGENVVQAYEYVQTGNADAGLVAFGLIQRPDGDGGEGPALPHRVVDARLHAPILQVGGVVRPSARASRAADFLSWVTGPEGQAILRRFGFEPPQP
jgi:molybdate transport system substrate-binding protein